MHRQNRVAGVGAVLSLRSDDGVTLEMRCGEDMIRTLLMAGVRDVHIISSTNNNDRLG